ncbi:MAG: tRNA glutamyl-Q(34) synthetase GluQRS, partial [Burkholderiales bacterium]
MTSGPDEQRPRAYVGRFAPSPTGPLHFGSLIAALASYVDARAAGGSWLLRIEDVDRERSRLEHEAAIRRQLAAFALEHDGDVVRQSERIDHYRSALERLRDQGSVYPCVCSRRLLETAPRNQEGEVIYPGSCRVRAVDTFGGRHSIRFKLAHSPPQDEVIEDRIEGVITQNVAKDVGDFVLLRADGDVAYQLAVVVDDELQGVTDVVRGADLLLNTPRQRILQRALGFRDLRYAHVPIVTNDQGEKLSKQTRAIALPTDHNSV